MKISFFKKWLYNSMIKMTRYEPWRNAAVYNGLNIWSQNLKQVFIKVRRIRVTGASWYFHFTNNLLKKGKRYWFKMCEQGMTDTYAIICVTIGAGKLALIVRIFSVKKLEKLISQSKPMERYSSKTWVNNFKKYLGPMVNFGPKTFHGFHFYKFLVWTPAFL